MLTNNTRINVSLTIFDGPPPIKDTIVVYCSSKTKFSDIYPYIEKECVVKTNDLRRICYAQINDDNVSPIDDFKVADFIRKNGIDTNDLKLSFWYTGTGGGDNLNDVLKIQIRSREGKHIGRPHIHISNNKGKKFVSVDLISFEILEGKRYWNKHFKKQEKKDIKKVITENSNEFIRYYNEITKGYRPNPVYFSYKGKEHMIE